MWCSFLGYDCSSSIECQYCPIWQKNNPVPRTQEYRYKCSCGGEFVEPVYKNIIEKIDHTDSNRAYTTSRNAVVCPFCAKEMKGF
jgi:redox-regulated HSP33 family molecular chaperone